MKFKEVALSSRPRERLVHQGVQTLSDAELIALILQTGTAQESVLDLAQRLIAQQGLQGLRECSFAECCMLAGIGPAKAAKLLAVFEIARRVDMPSHKTRIKCAQDVYNYARNRFVPVSKETVLLLHLDTKYCVVRCEVISVGTLNASLIHPREVFRSAIRESSHAVILVHNHPSGDPLPSEQDLEVTQEIKRAAELLDISFIDHVIIGSGCFWSFCESKGLNV